MEKIKVGVVFGGRSGEHEVSIRSARTVIEQIDKDKYEVVPIAVTKDGNWLNPVESLGLFPTEIQNLLIANVGNYPRNQTVFAADTKFKGLTKLEPADGEERVFKLDVIFPVLHGTFGEDGTIQGLFEMTDIPYVGCGVLASSCGMDKVVMKNIVPRCRFADLPLRLVFTRRMARQSNSRHQSNRSEIRLSVFRQTGEFGIVGRRFQSR